MSLENNALRTRSLVTNDAAWQSVDAAPDGAFDSPETQPVMNWQSVCGRGAACACGAAGISHVGCLIAFLVSAAGAAGSTSIVTVSTGLSLSLTAAGAGIWYVLRGHAADRKEKFVSLAGMALGAAATLGLHFSGAAGGHDHHGMDKALEWYRTKPQDVQTEIRRSAAALNRPLQDYILDICGPAPAVSPGGKIIAPGLDKL